MSETTILPWAEGVQISTEGEMKVAEAVIKSLNTPNLTPLQRYAVARFLLNALQRATEYEGAAAVQFCHQTETGLDGKQFRHNALDFRLHIVSDYNYQDNDDTGEFAMITRKLRLNRSENTILNNQLKNIKTNIRMQHPQMKAKLVKETIMLILPEYDDGKIRLQVPALDL
ncbi:MAG: hypothetical protein II970_00680 [Paludibacteraceae bacterium]|nr:hypothetical protein [Paludibacteraceae bacterium]